MKKSPKKKKHNLVFKKAPGAPKRFKSSYVHFFNHFIEGKKKEIGPDGLPLKIKIAELSAACSKIWKHVSPEDKKYWEGVSNKDKEEYLKKKDDYKGPWRVAKGKKKDPNAPKRAPSAFLLFVKDRRLRLKEEYPHLTHLQTIKTLGEMWKKLPADEQSPFRGHEEKLRWRYKIDTEKWKAGEEQRKRDGVEGVEARYKAYDDVQNYGGDHTRWHSPQPKPELVSPKEPSLSNHSSHYYSQDPYHWDYHHPSHAVESTAPLSYYEPSRCDNKSVSVTSDLSYGHSALQAPDHDRPASANVSSKATYPYHHCHSFSGQNNATYENSSAYLHERHSFPPSQYDRFPEQTSTNSTGENRYNPPPPVVHTNQQVFKEDKNGQYDLEKRSTTRN